MANLPGLRQTLPDGLTLECECPLPGPAIEANPERLQQVLTNLVTNAWEAMGSPEAAYVPHLEMPMYSRELFASERQVMLEMVRHAPSVLVGRCGFLALQDRPETLHVSIHSGLGFRVQSLVQRGRAENLQAALEAAKSSDRNRAELVTGISGRDWHDPAWFHLVLDVSRAGVDACAHRVIEEFHRCFPVTDQIPEPPVNSVTSSDRVGG